MGDLYYDLVSILTAAGCQVQVPAVCAGWERRARSSGGFSSPPIAVFHHHTASQTSPANDLSYMIDGCPDAPVGNLLIDRAGDCFPIAAGASNCAGKGNQMTFSRGVGDANNGNCWAFQIECANAGTGVEPWPQVQVDALFRASNALNAYVGNQPSDITSHALGKGNGYTDRKIDPATAGSVQGGWVPRSVNSSGTWDLDDMRAECSKRATPTPTPAPPEEDDVKLYLVAHPDTGEWFVTDMATFRTYVDSPAVGAEGLSLFGWQSLAPPGPTGLGAGWAPFLDQLPQTGDTP
jgi:hypothetical protein